MKTVYLDNDWIFRRKMQVAADGTPATNLVLTGFFALTKNGAAIVGTDQGLVEGPTTPDGWRLYAASGISKSALAAALAASVDKVIYERVTGGGYGDYEAVVVRAARPAGA